MKLCVFSAKLCVTITRKLHRETQRMHREPQRENLNDMNVNEITEKIIGCAIEVHKFLGPGLLESAYEECLVFELQKAGLKAERQKPIPVVYKDIKLDCGYRMDILVENLVIVELKTVDTLIPVHEAQILTHMKFADKNIGLLINFNVTLLKNGIKRYKR